MICHNPDGAQRKKVLRAAALERITVELLRIKTIRTTAGKTKKTPKASKTSTSIAKTNTDEAASVKAECALRDHPALGRWLRQLPSGRLVIDRVKVAAKERLDGEYLLSTSDPDLSAEDVVLGYKNLLGAERGFRDMKFTDGTAPCVPPTRAPDRASSASALTVRAVNAAICASRGSRRGRPGC